MVPSGTHRPAGRDAPGQDETDQDAPGQDVTGQDVPGGRVLAVSLNPALDVTYRVAELCVGDGHRVHDVEVVAGGKAVNVARVLAALGHPVTLTGLAGGESGAILRGRVKAAGIGDEMVDTRAETRRTVTVVDDAGRATGLWEPGPEIEEAEWSELTQRVTRLARHATVVVLSGSLPGQVPSDAYAILTRLAHDGGCAVIVDADGQALVRALRAGPELIKPNRAELRMAVGTPSSVAGVPPEAPVVTGSDWEADRRRADTLRRAGAGAVVVSAGADGMVAVTAEGSWSGASPPVAGGNPTGAGDAMVAALARGLAEGSPWPVTLADALALAASAVVCPTGGAVSLRDYELWRRQVTVNPLGRLPCLS